jgi:hypothetical protein
VRDIIIFFFAGKPLNLPFSREIISRGQKGQGHREISQENGQLSGFPAEKNNFTNFLNRPYIGSFMTLQGTI